MLIRITPKNSTHAVVASTRDKTTLEGLDTLCNLYEHMLHLQENQGWTTVAQFIDIAPMN